MKKTRTIVIHGGPGLLSGYLRAPLSDLFPEMALEFFEQSEGNSASLSESLKRCRDAMEKASSTSRCNVLCHSWGTLLLLLCIESHPELTRNIHKIVFSNPLPLTASGFGVAQARLFERVPEDHALRLRELMASDDAADHSEGLRQLYPYYSTTDSIPDAFKPEYDYRSFAGIFGEVGDYDLRKSALLGSENILCVFGTGDFIEPNDCAELCDAACQSINIDGGGHYPFLEKPQKFRRVISDFLN
ncbi:alpha/beta hydrolase [Parvularcula flava]|uniref:Alpha/beta hydrolase n=1 Tax=Aquisalinus luteolus TaxID=1566827 RepID=A0A8J3A082_9PROT|nr:alpha/beta hydrolase [Aquisalinus luteolus]NHK26385.1 alpha/beta hydrolase [Aquisalinus luteolus]GGH92175.1 hypothetical protein GCM10011355_01050 [Aquisalinus luteolus]